MIPLGGAEIFALAVLAVWTLVFARGLAGVRATRVATPPEPSKPVPPVAAFMPARDEAAVVEAAVRALVPQVASLTVVNDASTDGTGEILDRLAASTPNLTVVHADGPAEGQCGKPAALVRALSEHPPTAEWLLFVDADVVLSPQAVAAVFELAREGEADLVTLIPKVSLGSWAERVVMPAVGALVLAQHPPARVADPEDPAAFANGQLIAIRRSVYEAAGGHVAVVREVLEDVALARNAKTAGARLLVADGRHIAETRMYESWSELVEGWTKNLFLLMDARASSALKWAVLSVVLGCAGLLALTAGWPVGVSVYLAVLAMQATLRRAGGASPGWALFAPVGAVVAASLLVVSTWRHTRGVGVRWKGRAYRTEVEMEDPEKGA